MLIYILEDDENIREIESYTLKNSGYDVRDFDFPSKLYKALQTKIPDLIILDIMLPEEDGLSVLRWLRENPATKKLPIMMLSARSTEFDKVLGLDSGADDYLTKPFSVDELLARLRVTQRRIKLMNSTAPEPAVYINGPLRIEYASGCVYVNEEEIHLTPMEYRLLCLMSRNTGKVLTHKYILSNVWGGSWDEVDSLRVCMATLRRKLKKAPSAELIQTHIGIGYRMVRVD